MSPMLEGGSLIVQVGSDVHGGRVLALDPATGKERWTWKGLGPGYASPLAITVDGVTNPQLAACLGISTTTSTTLDVFVFDRCFEYYFWNYDNNGLKLLELRFYSAT